VSSFSERFARLEIPEEKRRVDWSFLDESLALPEPLPMGELPLACVMNGQVSAPADASPDGDGDWILYYAAPLALEARGTTRELEARWKAQHAAELERQAQRFLDGIPTEILRGRVDEALEILQLNAPRDHLFAAERILRIHHKLYNLVTLKEYAKIFEKAIDPGFFHELQAMPANVTPEEMLARIAGSLTLVHKKARSPLRNKMECARARIGGVTYLPLYREAAAGMLDAQRKLIERQLKVTILERHA
jgi:hypothetical protein